MAWQASSVQFAALAYGNRAAADDQYLLHVVILGHSYSIDNCVPNSFQGLPVRYMPYTTTLLIVPGGAWNLPDFASPSAAEGLGGGLPAA